MYRSGDKVNLCCFVESLDLTMIMSPVPFKLVWIYLVLFCQYCCPYLVTLLKGRHYCPLMERNGSVSQGQMILQRLYHQNLSNYCELEGGFVRMLIYVETYQGISGNDEVYNTLI